MKKYYLNALQYSERKMGAIRERYDIIRYLLSVIQFLNIEPLDRISDKSEDADVFIIVDKMSRLFWGTEDKIHSIQYPFQLKESDGSLISTYDDRKIDSETIAVLLTILEGRECFTQSIDDMLDYFMDTMNDFEIRDNDYARFCWSLLLHLLSFEPGYLRYDHDENEKRKNAVRHPVDHIDFYYSGNNTFKVGLKDRIGLNDLQTIVNINERCCFLNY